jgi:hypothetical protein
MRQQTEIALNLETRKLERSIVFHQLAIRSSSVKIQEQRE